jgi:hypothetical protein
MQASKSPQSRSKSKKRKEKSHKGSKKSSVFVSTLNSHKLSKISEK